MKINKLSSRPVDQKLVEEFSYDWLRTMANNHQFCGQPECATAAFILSGSPVDSQQLEDLRIYKDTGVFGMQRWLESKKSIAISK
jgi:hypothetical protein